MKLRDKTLIGKELFELYLERNGDQAVYAEVADKYQITVSTVRSYLSQYRKRTVSPKPTLKEADLYDNILRELQVIAGARSARIKPEIEEPSMLYDTNLISQLLKLKKVRDLIKYATETSYNVTELLKQTERAIDGGFIDKREILKLKKISAVLEGRREDITNNRREFAIKIKQRQTENKHLNTIESIIETCLIEGNHNFYNLLIENDMSEHIFEKYYPLLEEGNDNQKLLFSKYNLVLEEERKNHEEVYFKVLDYLKNGIEKNGSITAFNLLDYYELTTMDPKEFQKRGHKFIYEDKLRRYDYNLVANFFQTYNNSFRVLTEEEALDYFYAVDGREVTLEEKQYIINYLQNVLGVKLYVAVYQCACEAAIKGQLKTNALAFE